MIKNLVIVESPAKAATIEKFLGPDYKVMSSTGHIRDLVESGLGVDIENNFTPNYVIPADKHQTVVDLKKAAASAQTVWLASDEDREGEAIAWHLFKVLDLKPENTRRIVFHEITKPAILKAIENPRDIDLNLVDAQQARRVLDRIVGFELSPVLWKKIKSSLSAGRVQSVAVRLVVDREKEINNFVSEPYFRVTGVFATPKGQLVKGELSKRLPDAAAAKAFLEDCAKASFEVGQVQVKPVKKSPAPPFTTSTLQQEASRKLGFPVQQTMKVAQRLYEAGHITYMRTDSTNLSSLAIDAISEEITDTLGAEYLHVRHYHTSSKGAQEAHEAIRPTYVNVHSIDGTAQEKRLYALIWKRAVASQMADSESERTTVDIKPSTCPEHFTVSGDVVKFDGFLRVYADNGKDEEEEAASESMLPAMKVGDKMESREINALERFTQQPSRYTEATLVKKMEELGIGRPSTYATTISNIQSRDYVTKGEKPGAERKLQSFTLADGKITEAVRTESTGADKGKLIPTDVGTIVDEFLETYFADVVDYNFTANIEEKFDSIAEGKLEWSGVMSDFYSVFHPEVDKVLNTQFEHKVGERVLGVDPATGKTVAAKVGRFGPVVQIGSSKDEEKPQFASLHRDQSIYTITLEEALKLFELPRTLGKNAEGEEISAAVGRFGPYVRCGKLCASIPEGLAPQTITLDEAIALIEAKQQAALQQVAKSFDQDPDVQILNGRFGPYIKCKNENYKIPKGTANAIDLTYEQVMEIVNNPDNKTKGGKAKGAKAAKSSSKKK